MRRPTVQVSALLFAVAFAFAVTISPATLAQQTPTNTRPLYNVATETTVSGTVASISHVTGRRGWGGLHFQLHTDKEILDVHAGPSSFLVRQNFTITVGDHVVVTGSKIRYNNSDALLARILKKGDSEITLRNPQGIPAWSRGRPF